MAILLTVCAFLLVYDVATAGLPHKGGGVRREPIEHRRHESPPSQVGAPPTDHAEHLGQSSGHATAAARTNLIN